MKNVKAKIRKVINCGAVRWMVDLRRFNSGRKFFATEDEARIHWDAKAKEARDLGIAALALTHEQRVEFLSAEQRLKPLGARIAEAVDFFLKHSPGLQRRTLKAAYDEFLHSKKSAGKRVRYLQTLKSSVGQFVETRPEDDCAAVSRAEVEQWLQGNGYKPATVLSKMTDLKVFFGFCQKRGYIRLNPCLGIERPRLDDKPPGILTVEQCAKLMRTAQVFEKGRLLPYAALALFAGIRPEELDRLTWEHVQVERGFVEVPGWAAKTRKRRLVELTENAKAWLRLGGPLPVVDRWRTLVRVREAAGLTEWPHDALRHSFASYHLAMWRSADRTATEMGHYSTDMLFKHYREVVTKEDAERFWNILPEVKQ